MGEYFCIGNKKVQFFNFKCILILAFYCFSIGIFLGAANSTITFNADSVNASISENKKVTNLVGNTNVKVDDLQIFSDRMEIYGKDYQYLNATGNVKGEDKDKGYSFKADYIKFDRNTDIVLMYGKIELNDSKNNITITAENVEYRKKAEIMIMRFNVKIVKKDITCNTMFALYNRKNSTLELTGHSVVKKNTDEFKAAKISVNLDTEDIILDGRVSGTVQEKKEDSLPEDKTQINSEEEKNQVSSRTEDSDGLGNSESYNGRVRNP